MMRSSTTILGFCLLLAVKASAQVTVDLLFDQDQYLPAESLVLGVRVTNFSGQTLHFGKENDWLAISIEAGDGLHVHQVADVPVAGEFAVESSSRATRRFDLAPYFDLDRPGRYQVTVSAKVSDWGTTVTSKPKHFDVIRGTTLWTQAFGVPNPPDQAHVRPEVRRYALQQAIYLRQMKLYVRVSDSTDSHVLSVFPIGPMVSFSRPETQIDKSSNLHVLYQTGARSFNYSVINPNGVRIASQTHEYTSTRPVLSVDNEGKIVVAGGVRRIAASDLPAPQAAAPAIPPSDAGSAKP